MYGRVIEGVAKMVSREVELCKYGGEDNAGNWSNEEKEH